jgi:hypothetical protein
MPAGARALGSARRAHAGKKRGRDTALMRFEEFHEWFRGLRFLDPACGSGSFLYLTMHAVKRIEFEVIRADMAFHLATRTALTATPFRRSSRRYVRGLSHLANVRPGSVGALAGYRFVRQGDEWRCSSRATPGSGAPRPATQTHVASGIPFTRRGGAALLIRPLPIQSSHLGSDAMPNAPLTTALATFHAFASERRIPLVPGSIDRKILGFPLVAFTPDDPRVSNDVEAEMQAFTSCLTELEVGLAVVWVDRLTESERQDAVDEYQDALDRLEETDQAEQDVNEQRHALGELLAAAKALKALVGQIAMLEVQAITRNPAIMIEFLAFAPWNSVVQEAEEQVQEIERDDSAEDGEESDTSEVARARHEEWETQERERRLWTSKRRTETARRLAESPDFNKCKREADRVYMLRKMLGDETPSDDHMLKEISREALAIYSLDIAKKP